MEHRRREAMRSVKLSWFTAERGRSLSNKYVPSEVGIYACISSRITTVIHVVNTTKETIADLMSHSQFHSITLILRHAWLNLWDKHMTTGRINQITILKEEATSSKKERNRNLFFFSHPFPLARRYLLSLETAEIPEKLLFQVSLLPEMLSVQKAFTLLTSALRHHTIALFEFPLIRFHQTDTPVFHGMVRLISLIWEEVTLEESQSCDRLFNKAFPQVWILWNRLLLASNPPNPSLLTNGIARCPRWDCSG